MICNDYLDKSAPAAMYRLSSSVSADIERLLGPKSLIELETLEKQISSKLQSNEPIDVEYWEQLLRNVAVYKSRAELSNVYKDIIENRLSVLRQEQRAEASNVKEKLTLLIAKSDESPPLQSMAIQYSRQLDPEPLLKLRSEEKPLEVTDEKTFMEKNVSKSKLEPLTSRLQCSNRYKRGKESHN